MTSEARGRPDERHDLSGPTGGFDGSRVHDRDRLLALRRTALLDSRHEEAFDRLTRRACEAISVPVALVSLVDADRQFFKSAQELREPFASARQTPLSYSFCRYVVAGERPLVVSDAREVAFLAGSPGIADLAMIGYAGVPLCAHGFVLGAFCAIDGMPHQWSAEDLGVLEDLGSACSTEIHLRDARRGDVACAASSDFARWPAPARWPAAAARVRCRQRARASRPRRSPRAETSGGCVPGSRSRSKQPSDFLRTREMSGARGRRRERGFRAPDPGDSCSATYTGRRSR